MRLPFTVNRPNAKKIKGARVPVLADIVADLRDLVVYALEEFATAAVTHEMTTTRTESSGTAYETIGSPVGPKRGQRRGRQPENQKKCQRKSRKPAECYRLSACELSSTALGNGPSISRPLATRAFTAKHLNIGSCAARPVTPDTTSSGKV